MKDREASNDKKAHGKVRGDKLLLDCQACVEDAWLESDLFESARAVLRTL